MNNKNIKMREVKAVSPSLRVSPIKLNNFVKTIVGMSVSKALVNLAFVKKSILSDYVKSLLYSAMSNAENNNNLDIDSLVVSEAYVGKSITMKRYRAKAKGMAGRIKKRNSILTIILKEV